MRNHRQHLRAAVIGLMVCCGMPSIAFADWTIDSPPNSVQLVGVDQVAGGVLRFTLKNVSDKPIVYLDANAPDGNETGIDAFVVGQGEIEPGATRSVTFGWRDFPAAIQNHSIPTFIRIVAIVYADGSRVGSKQRLDEIEDEMLGAALEIKRDSDILAARPDVSSAGFNAVVENIGRQLPSTDEEAAASVRGEELSGISQSYIEAHLNRRSGHLRIGIDRARGSVLSDINLVKSNASVPMGPQGEALVKQAQLHALSDLAQEYRVLSEKQVQCIKGYIETLDAN
ncbi:MAG TPA: hypothetical protein VMQ76_13355 [Terracidiphilus sp.]|nr:hypothetical protein [Terracidiphilus sp.]